MGSGGGGVNVHNICVLPNLFCLEINLIAKEISRVNKVAGPGAKFYLGPL